MPENKGTKTADELRQHRTQLITDPSQLPDPSLQPGSLPDEGPVRFSTTEIVWWNNGIWGQAGYAIPNDGGKPVTKNDVLWTIHRFIGRELFNVMHKPDVRFTRPPNADWLHQVAKMVRLGRKRLLDRAVDFNDERRGDAMRNTTSTEEFIVYPVPYFGGRIRNYDAKYWCGIMLVALGEMMQHPDNDLDGDITTLLASYVDRQLRRIEFDIATKYLGIPRETAESPDFVLPDVIDESNYNPNPLFTEAEMIDERPPVDWWPTANDLSPIAGIPASVAKAYGMRWPISGEAFYGDQGSHERAFPGGSTGPGRVINPPGGRAADAASRRR